MNQTSIPNKLSKLKPSTQENSLHPSTLHPKPTFRYFRRTFNLNEGYSINALKLNLKRIHIKKVVEANSYIGEGEAAQKRQFEANKRCLKKKLFKCLTDLNFSDLNTSYWLEEFKHAHRLTKLSFKPGMDCTAKIIASYFKRMNKHVENIEFFIEDSSEMRPCDIFKAYKVIRGYPKLKTYKGQSEVSEWKQEFQYLYRCLSKLSKLEEFEYFFSKRSQNPLQELMKEGQTYPKVTKLRVSLGRMLLRGAIWNTLFDNEGDNEENEYSEEEDDKSEKKIESKDLNSSQTNLLFQFHIFPNLKSLEIKAHKLDESLCPSFCSSLAETFEHLPQLEKLFLKLPSHPSGTDFILQGLLKLPLLTSFSFRIDCMNLSQGNLLNAFIKKQTNLVSMQLEIRNSDTEELQENQFLENFLESLSHKPLLQYLTLNLNSWEAQYLSEGFDRLQGSDQIKAFQFQIREFIACRPMEKPFKELCDFLLRNKETLEDLALDLAVEPLFEAEMNRSLSTAIPQLTQLQNFNLKFHLDESEMTNYQFNLDLKSILLKLESLQCVVLNLDYLLDFPPESRKWMVECFEVLPWLKNLRRLEFSIPLEGLDRTEINMIATGLEGLNRFVKIEFSSLDDDLEYYDQEMLEEILMVYRDVGKKQAF